MFHYHSGFHLLSWASEAQRTGIAPTVRAWDWKTKYCDQDEKYQQEFLKFATNNWQVVLKMYKLYNNVSKSYFQKWHILLQIFIHLFQVTSVYSVYGNSHSDLYLLWTGAREADISSTDRLQTERWGQYVKKCSK